MVAGAPADERSDQSSFCSAFYEALSRRRPYVGDTGAKLQQAKLQGALRLRFATDRLG